MGVPRSLITTFLTMAELVVACGVACGVGPRQVFERTKDEMVESCLGGLRSDFQARKSTVRQTSFLECPGIPVCV